MTIESHAKTKRKRGHPRGASKYAKSDRAILKKVADCLNREPGLVRTDLIRRYRIDRVEVTKESDIRLLNKIWRTNKEELLADAKRRRDTPANLGWFGNLAGVLPLFTDWSERLLNSAAENDTSRLFAIVQEDVDAGLRQRTAHTAMGLSPKPPIDIDDSALDLP